MATLDIKPYNCVCLKQRQSTKVCTPIQTNLLCDFRTRFIVKIQLIFNKSKENAMILLYAGEKEKISDFKRHLHANVCLCINILVDERQKRCY